MGWSYYSIQRASWHLTKAFRRAVNILWYEKRRHSSKQTTFGHCYFMHSFLLTKEEPPVCVACNTTITVKHILIECADLVEVRKKSLEERSLYSLLRNVNLEKMFWLPERDQHVLSSIRYFNINFMWRSIYWNILTVIQKSCGFVEISVILCMCVCMFDRNTCDFVYVCVYVW